LRRCLGCAVSPTADFTRILRTLQTHRVDFIVVGGVSAVLHGAPVSTFDLDIIHDRSPENVDRLVSALATLHAYYRCRPGQRIHPAAAHLSGPGHQLLLTDAGPLDVLGALGETEYKDLLNDTTEFNLEGIPGLRVLNLDRLIQLKEAAGREKDHAVLPVLRRTLAERDKG
jgi:hypothetical protein